MIHFNELYITEDGKNLVIDAEIDDMPIYDDMYISSVQVTTGESYVELCNFSKGVEVPVEEGRRHIQLCLSVDNSVLSNIISDGHLGNRLLFVQVEADGELDAIASELGCGWDNSCIIGAAFNGYPMYRSIIGYADADSRDCSFDYAPFIDYIMRYYGFMFALRSGDYPQALRMWKDYLTSEAGTSAPQKPCGCHGRR